MFERVQHGRSDLYYADPAGILEIANADILNLGDRVYCVSYDMMLYAGFDGLYDEGGSKQISFHNPNAQAIPLDDVSEGNGGGGGGLLRGSGTPSPVIPVIPDEIINSSFKLIEAGGNGRLWYAMSFGLEALSEYLEFADRVYIIDQGKVLMWTGEDYVEDVIG